jgi:hypothetical protein
MRHFKDDGIPHAWHQLNEVRRTKALQDFQETPQWQAFTQTHAYIDFMHAYPSRAFPSPNNKLLQDMSSRLLRARSSASQLTSSICRGGRYECDEYCHVTLHFMTLNKCLLLINPYFSMGRTYPRLRRNCNKYDIMHYHDILPINTLRTVNLTCSTTLWYDSPRQTRYVAIPVSLKPSLKPFRKP